MPETFFIICWARIARIVLHTLTGLVLATFVLPVCNRWVRLGLIQWWCKRLLACFNIRVTTSGQLPDIKTHGVMFVANHISWTDIHAINSVIPVRFIAKLEIRSWPIFGYLVKKSGTIFINRTRSRDAARVLKIACHALKLNDNLCVFPEGTTTEGLGVMPFKSSLLQAAIDAQTTIIPVVIHYPLPDGQPNIEAAYAGDTSLAESMQRFLHMSSPVVHLHFCAPISSAGHTRQALAKITHQTIAAQLAAGL